MRNCLVHVFCLSVSVAGCLYGWNGHEVTGANITVIIDEIPDVADPHQPVPVTVRVRNEGAEVLQSMVSVADFADAWRCIGDAEKALTVEPSKEGQVLFEIVSGDPVYDALYPVHAYVRYGEGEGASVLHAVRIFGVKKSPAPEQVTDEDIAWPVNVLAADSVLPLYSINTHRIAWRYYDGPIHVKPVGWMGSDPESRASMGMRPVSRGGVFPAIVMHPPWHPGGGTMFCDYQVALPDAGSIFLLFANAIRDHSETEPGSDGVLFRVRVNVDGDGSDGTVLYENFTDSKVWVEGRADLTPYAGKTVILRLESHPGPNKNTSCDSSYWGQPVLVSGRAVEMATEKPEAGPPEDAAGIAKGIASGQEVPDEGIQFALKGSVPCGVVVNLGSMGLLNGWVTFAGPTGTASFRGIEVDLLDENVGRWPSLYSVEDVSVLSLLGKTRVRHRLVRDGEPVVLDMVLWRDNAGLRIRVECERRITRVAPGPWSAHAERIYYGHGYCITEPEAFRAGFGGHNLSTSHVGFDFDTGLAVLQAVDTPPDYLDVDPAKRGYALVSHMDSVLTFVPGTTAMQCAMDYRPLYDKRPADGVDKLAGRFCFDIWGGKYADIAERMQQMVDYGLTDSFLTVHNWQRWGYDYRLPDIYPPNPAFGTEEELASLGQLCRENDIPWGLHDNYIDFYPDAEGYTYENIYFTRAGEPHKAWHNRGREAYSYKWRPDKILPVVKRNFRLVKKGLHPTHSFLDVFTSTKCTDYWDNEGAFHSSLETRKCWGETFAWIRDYLGGNAPTTSEAGHDQLIGYLDGADCQWLRLVKKGRKHAIQLRCKEWVRVPWYDAVNHHRFVLHGVGYSIRYQGGLSRIHHGVNSDDYLSAEMLTGHALMVDSGCFGRDAVRKYWLAQEIARSLAGAKMVNFEFMDGDVRHQHVVWDNGVEVFVNRSDSEWVVKDRHLPQFGYLAVLGDGSYSVVERIGSAFAESSVGEDGWYCNARTVSSGLQKRVHTMPTIEDFKNNGDGSFTYRVLWKTLSGSKTGPHRIFVHFCSDKDLRGRSISMQDDHDPPVPTPLWKGNLRITRTVVVPDNLKGTYHILTGLYNGRGRALIDGVPAGEDRVSLGTVTIKRDGDAISSIEFVPPEPVAPTPPPAVNQPGTTVDFDFAATDGAFRVQEVGDGLELTPLPDSPPFTTQLRLGALGLAGKQVKGVTRNSEDGPVGSVPFYQGGGSLGFDHDGRSFSYLIHFGDDKE